MLTNELRNPVGWNRGHVGVTPDLAGTNRETTRLTVTRVHMSYGGLQLSSQTILSQVEITDCVWAVVNKSHEFYCIQWSAHEASYEYFKGV